MKRSYSIDLGEKTITATILERSGSRLTFEVQGRQYSVSISPIPPATSVVASPSSATVVVAPRPVMPPSHSTTLTASEDAVITPMPGMVAAVFVKVGQAVEVGTPLVVVEAMKMENSVPSPRSGTIKEVLVQVGQELSFGDVLIRLA